MSIDIKQSTLEALVLSLRYAGFRFVPGRGYGSSVWQSGKCEVQLVDQGHGDIDWWVGEHLPPRRLRPEEVLSGYTGERRSLIMTARISPAATPTAKVTTRNAEGDGVVETAIGPMPVERLAETLIDASTREVNHWVRVEGIPD